MIQKMRIDVFYTEFTKHLPEQLWTKLISTLSDDLKKKNSCFRRWEDKHAHLFGKLLLLKGFKKYGYAKEELPIIKYGPHGKPYCEGIGVNFNISHSGNCVICAMGSNLNLGVDVEKIRTVNFKYLETSMNEKQWSIINNSTEMFFKFWTIKESVIKADGRGLNLNLNEVHINRTQNMARCNGKNWYLTKLHINDKNSAFLASNVRASNVCLKYVDFYA